MANISRVLSPGDPRDPRGHGVPSLGLSFMKRVTSLETPFIAKEYGKLFRKMKDYLMYMYIYVYICILFIYIIHCVYIEKITYLSF